MYCDHHVHSHFSSDSHSTIHDICLEAIRKGMKMVCITDHMDAVNHQLMNDLRVVECFFKEFEAEQHAFSGQICLVAGFEFSEPNKNVRLYERMLEFPFKYHMCSVHHCAEGRFLMPNNIELHQAIHEYLENVKETIMVDQIDCLGHIDLIRRYYGSFPYIREEMQDVLRKIIEKEILLEVNTSSFLRGALPLPVQIDYVQDYIALGGRDIVLGSDAHRVEDIGKGFEQLSFDNITVRETGGFLWDRNC